MTLQPRRYTITILLIAFTLLACQFAALMVVDPLRLFHKPWVRDDYFIRELRFQASGIIRNTEFDSIVLGSSMAANFSPREASRLWNAKFVNLSPDGSGLLERSIILNFALAQKKIKNVIFSLDSFHEYGKHQPSFATTNYDYLYNESRADDLKIYSNLKYVKFLFCRNIVFTSDALCKTTKDLETVAEWASFKMNSKRFGGLNKWFESRNNGQIKQALRRIVNNARSIKNGTVEVLNPQDLSKKAQGERLSFEHYVMHYVEENPDTQFHLYFPPHSRMSKALLKKAKPGDYQLYIERMRYVVSAIERYPNARAYGFDHLEFTDDIANYKDPSHHHPRFNSAMLRWMKNRDHELTRDTIEAYIKISSELAEHYDIDSFAERIESFLGEAYSGSE